jgi:hypothetical protein
MSLILFNSKIRINIFSIKNYTKNTDNMFAYTFNNICANFAHFGRMKVNKKNKMPNITKERKQKK